MAAHCTAGSRRLPVVVVAGMGPGASRGISERYSREGFAVAMLARTQQKLDEFEMTIPNSKGYAVDLSDETSVNAASQRIIDEMGSPEILVYNASTGSFSQKGFLSDSAVSDMQRNLGNNLYGLLYTARAFAPAMVERARGAIIVTGNTSSRRGLAHTPAFAPTKAAQRILAESMARYLGPKQVHVGYVLIDAAIDMPWARELVAKANGGKPADDTIFCTPEAIADAVFALSQQDKQGWTFEMDIRPFREKW